MISPVFSVGVDLGGTWIRVEAVDRGGRRVRFLKAPAPSLSELPSYLKKRFQIWRSRPEHLTIASRGIWTRSERGRLKRALRSLASHVRVISDVEGAWHAAFGSARIDRKVRPVGRRAGLTHGVIVIAGTGSIAYGRDPAGRTQRAGGWGPLLGDEGSAFWIGKRWLQMTRGHDSPPEILQLARSAPTAVRRIAALAPRALRQAATGSGPAGKIVREAQQHLASLAAHVVHRLDFKKIVPVSWGGSLLDNPDFRSGFLRALRQTKKASGRRFEVVAPHHNPALAIAKERCRG